MIVRHSLATVATSVALFALAARAYAADPAVPSSPTPAAAASYDDPGMHIAAPPGWQKIEFPPADPQATDEKRTLVAFVYHRGERDQRTIAVTLSNDSDSLEAFNRTRESDLRQAGDGTFVHGSKRTLANGMPTYWLSTELGNQVGHYMHRYEELVYDGTRDIDVVYSGREGDFTEEQATADLASLYVVRYPHRRE